MERDTTMLLPRPASSSGKHTIASPDKSSLDGPDRKEFCSRRLVSGEIFRKRKIVIEKRKSPREREKKIIGDLERNGSISDQGKKFKRRLQ